MEREDSTGLEYNMILESALDSDSFQVMLVTVAPGADREPVAGEGRELLYLLSGTVEYQVGEEKIEMHSGDTLFFDGDSAPCAAQFFKELKRSCWYFISEKFYVIFSLEYASGFFHVG